MELEEAKKIEVVRCFTNPEAGKPWAGQECVVRQVLNGWVLIQCKAGWFNIRSWQVETLDNAIELGWVERDSLELAGY